MKGLVLKLEMCEEKLIDVISEIKEVKNFLDEYECCFGEEYVEGVRRIEREIEELVEVVYRLYRKMIDDGERI